MRGKLYFKAILFLVSFSITSEASDISRITLSDLESRSELIVMAKVIALEKEGNRDRVTIRIASSLKGDRPPEGDITFYLVTRGGLKDFDPSLREGDTGVFFLKRGRREGEYEKAYWGSIATFRKNHFDLIRIP